MNWRDRVYCGTLTPAHAGERPRLMGWVDAIRDHGNLIFIHLRDITGIVQVVFDPRTSPEAYALAERLGEESALELVGKVALRGRGTENPYIETGSIEVYAEEVVLHSSSDPLPFKISEKAILFGEEIQSNPENVDEELRLRYRYLDLRRPSVQKTFIKRHKIVGCIRDTMEDHRFIELETPFLTRSTPEGARDYLVPSRVHPGKFYALPQSPQLFKQLFMIGGMDRYYQIARCFRDEDLRPNRQPEFTQLDLEASFVDEEFIYEVIEELVVRMFAVGDIPLSRPFRRMTYQEVMARYGTDRPDLRFDMAFEEVTDIMKETDYAIFKGVVRGGGCIKGFRVRGAAEKMSKNLLQNEYAMRIVPSFGGRGMTWMKAAEGTLQSNIVQFFTPSELERLQERFGARDGDVLMMVADKSRDSVNQVLCSLRLHVANRLGLAAGDRYRPLWVTHFPLFERKEEGVSSLHHPFTMPDRIDFDPTDTEELLTLNSRAYDLVMNGEELGGGSIRIHDAAVQQKVFRALGLSRAEAEAKFGFFLKALKYGPPPHAGLALGLDRVVAMILKTGSIRDVIAFPKNRRAFCPLTHAPADVSPDQLEDLGITAGTGDSGTDAGPAGRSGVPAETAPVPEKITVKEVRHVAKLARLKLDEAEIEGFQEDLNAILDSMDTLKTLDTEEVEPMKHVLDIKNVWREDEPRKSKDAESVLENAPQREGDYFRVTKILEG